MAISQSSIEGLQLIINCDIQKKWCGSFASTPL
jgi:hypothetical protein